VANNKALAAEHLAACRQELKDQFKKIVDERKANERASYNCPIVTTTSNFKSSGEPAAEDNVGEKSTFGLTKFQLKCLSRITS
jgi:hypothetical protein